ncbi:hypothetical protein [Pseudoalteromonas aurantia]|uniref:Uncharacterized protein n=1 Tax=Pseudoalteromonas aurantia TaxID=43654 RepID=A0ABY2VWG6_9GAMM|nr:hypothetical protein [Pseudoalteromonas aurantia]TMO73658.1 hypothetical protein CWC20_12700 [Pseudoalteromonas aurantia]
MPVSFIKDAILDHLAKIDYKRQSLENPDIKGVLKEVILSGDKCNVQLFSEREFEVKIPEKTYYEIVATSFFYSFQKVKEQSGFLTSAALKNIPASWVIVSAYYSAFYSAVELAKLYGFYNVFLKKEHCDRILIHADGGSKLDRGNYLGVVDNEVKDYITIRFSSAEKAPPHDLAWKNMLKILDFSKVQDLRDTKVSIYNLLKGVLNTSSVNIQTPNNVRNDWNYSYANAYDQNFCSDIEVIKTYLLKSGKLSIMSWPSQYTRMTRKQNDVMSVIYIEAILRQTMIDLNERLIS